MTKKKPWYVVHEDLEFRTVQLQGAGTLSEARKLLARKKRRTFPGWIKGDRCLQPHSLYLSSEGGFFSGDFLYITQERPEGGELIVRQE